MTLEVNGKTIEGRVTASTKSVRLNTEFRSISEMKETIEAMKKGKVLLKTKAKPVIVGFTNETRVEAIIADDEVSYHIIDAELQDI